MSLKNAGFLFLGLVVTFVAFGEACAGTIKVGDKEYEDAELFEIGVKGPFYKVGDDIVVMPWAEVDRFQAAAIRKRFAEALVNLQRKAYWVKGTVFEKNEEGVVIHTGSSRDDESGDEKKETRKEQKEKMKEELLERKMVQEGSAVFKNGAEVVTGLVILKDLQRTKYGIGGDVEALVYKVGEVPYEMGLGMKKKLMLCNLTLPEWVGVRKWKNSAGKDMVAELIAVKGGKCLFKRNERNFIYELNQLSESDQKLVADFQKNSRVLILEEEK